MPFLTHAIHYRPVSSIMSLASYGYIFVWISAATDRQQGAKWNYDKYTSATNNYHYQRLNEFMAWISNHIILIT